MLPPVVVVYSHLRGVEEDDQMEKFMFTIVPRYGMKGQIHKDKEGKPLEIWGENRAIDVAHKVYRELRLHKVYVTGEGYRTALKIERRCKCTNVQLHINGDYRCVGCGIVLSTIKAEVQEEVAA